MNELTTNEIIFLMKLVSGIAEGLDAMEAPYPYEDLGDAYNSALDLKRKLFNELERRNKEEY